MPKVSPRLRRHPSRLRSLPSCPRSSLVSSLGSCQSRLSPLTKSLELLLPPRRSSLSSDLRIWRHPPRYRPSPRGSSDTMGIYPEMKNALKSPPRLRWGVPQGSVLWFLPIRFQVRCPPDPLPEVPNDRPSHLPEAFFTKTATDFSR